MYWDVKDYIEIYFALKNMQKSLIKTVTVAIMFKAITKIAIQK